MPTGWQSSLGRRRTGGCFPRTGRSGSGEAERPSYGKPWCLILRRSALTLENLGAELTWQTSTSHSTLSALLKTDFEQPIRELPSKIVAWRRVGEQDSSLDKNLKDYEKVSAKLDKAAGKKAGKADAYQQELNQLTQSLSSLSPMVYTTYQRLDEQRLSTLKEIVVRWGTIKGDMAVRDGERAERSVGNLLGWETGDEVMAVGQKLGGGAGGGSRAGSAAPSFGAAPSFVSGGTRKSDTAHIREQKADFQPGWTEQYHRLPTLRTLPLGQPSGRTAPPAAPSHRPHRHPRPSAAVSSQCWVDPRPSHEGGATATLLPSS